MNSVFFSRILVKWGDFFSLKQERVGLFRYLVTFTRVRDEVLIRLARRVFTRVVGKVSSDW